MDAAIAAARQRLADVRSARSKAHDARQQIGAALRQHEECYEEFEHRLQAARPSGSRFRCVRPGETGRYWREVELAPRETRIVDQIRSEWLRCTNRLRNLARRLDLKINRLQGRADKLARWIEERAATWGRLDPESLKEQVKEILRAGDELSLFLLGRKVPIVFDTRDDAPLGHVPVHKRRGEPRKVHLTAELLGRQPQHLLDYYRALIVHELGHLLLHLKESAREYRKLRRLLARRISLAPEFFQLFNLLLDEQLERVLRDTRPEWQRWFNRLDFYTRRIPLDDLRRLLASSGVVDVEARLAELERERLVKRYDDPLRPFLTIQSARLFSQGLGFTRMYAFYAVFAQQLRRSTIEEDWLRRCLDCIPADFKSLDLYGVHAVAVEIYKILMEDQPSCEVATFQVVRGDGRGDRSIAIPGCWLPGVQRERCVVLRIDASSAPKSLVKERSPPATPSAPPGDPEGGPPPPPPPPPPAPRPDPIPKSPSRRRASPAASLPPAGRDGAVEPPPTRPPPPAPWSNPGTAGESSPADATSPRMPSARRAAQRQERKSRQRAAERARQSRRLSRRETRERARREARRPSPPTKPSPTTPSTAPLAAPAPYTPPPDVSRARAVALAAAPHASLRDAQEAMNQALDRLVAQARSELAGRPTRIVDLVRMESEPGPTADYRRTGSEREFPPFEALLRLRRDSAAQRRLEREVRPLVAELAPYIAWLDWERELEERRPVGRRLVGSGLCRHVAYGERRIFADFREQSREHDEQLLVVVLIDSSASMGADDRLGRAQRVAALVAACLRDRPGVDSAMLAFNHNLYLCGDHDRHALGALRPAGKTNEAAALCHVREELLQAPRRGKLVLVLGDGLPTACTVESCVCEARRLEREAGARLVHVALSREPHPAYRQRVELAGPLNRSATRALGAALRGALLEQ